MKPEIRNYNYKPIPAYYQLRKHYVKWPGKMWVSGFYCSEQGMVYILAFEKECIFRVLYKGRLYQRNIQGGEDYTVTNPANAAGRFLKEVIISNNKS